MHTIQELIKQAHTYHWPYPKLFEELKKADVVSYAINFAEGKGFKGIYRTTTEEFQEDVPAEYQELVANTMFTSDKIEQAVIERAQNKTTYVQFLSRIADAGVTHYNVDMKERTVTYYNADESKYYQQIVPMLS